MNVYDDQCFLPDSLEKPPRIPSHCLATSSIFQLFQHLGGTFLVRALPGIENLSFFVNDVMHRDTGAPVIPKSGLPRVEGTVNNVFKRDGIFAKELSRNLPAVETVKPNNDQPFLLIRLVPFLPARKLPTTWGSVHSPEEETDHPSPKI